MTRLTLTKYIVDGKTVPMLQLEGTKSGIDYLQSLEEGEKILDAWADKYGLDQETVKSFKTYIKEAFIDEFRTMTSFEKMVQIQNAS